MKMSQTSPDPATAGPGLVSHDYVEDLAAASHLEQGDPTRVASFFGIPLIIQFILWVSRSLFCSVLLGKPQRSPCGEVDIRPRVDDFRYEPF